MSAPNKMLTDRHLPADCETTNDASMHQTVSFNIYRWADLVHQTVDCAARRDVKPRQSVSGGALPRTRPRREILYVAK